MKADWKILTAATVLTLGLALAASAGTVNVTLQQGVDGYGGCSDAMISHALVDTVESALSFKDSTIYYMRNCFI